MELFIALIGGLTIALIVVISQLARTRYVMGKRHLESLYRLSDIVKVSLPVEQGELVDAAIQEEIDEI